MEEYERFIVEYKKVADEILDKQTPLEVVKVIEENLPEIHELSKNLEEYLTSIDELSVNIKSNKKWKIHQEIDSISRPISELNPKFKNLFETKGTKYYWDSEIASIIKLFCLYNHSIPERINTNIEYKSKNDDFLLVRKEIERERESNNLPDLNDYKRILIQYKGDRTKIYNEINEGIPERNRNLLKQLIKGEDIGSGKFIYHGEVKNLIDPFKELYYKNLIQSRYTTIIHWLQENFKSFHKDGPKELNLDTIKKNFRKK
tara:strand:- start:210 stop:989 length:780 start_codon:yes stop_codon:yes gene_type:complete